MELQELQELKKSELRTATKFLNNTIDQQLQHIKSEFMEVCEETAKLDNEKYDPVLVMNNLAMELVDLQMSCETALAILGYRLEERRQYRKLVIAKNKARKYYRGKDVGQ